MYIKFKNELREKKTTTTNKIRLICLKLTGI